MAFLPNAPSQEEPLSEPVAQGDMWGTLKNIMRQIPSNPIGLDPMPLSYVAKAPSFISKLIQGFKGGKALLPEEITASKDLLKAGMNPLQNRKNQSFIDKWGNSWGSPKSHSNTLLDVINSKNDPADKIPLAQYLFDKEYDVMPKGLGDYQMIRSAGEYSPGVANFEVPLNATADSLKGASDLVKRGDTLITDYKVPIRGTDSTNNAPFKEFLTSKDIPLRKTFKNFDPKEFQGHSQDLDQKVQGLYPEFKKSVEVPDLHSLAAKLDPENPVKYVGEQMGFPMFQQESPGVGSFMMRPGDSIEQAFQRARTRYLNQK